MPTSSKRGTTSSGSSSSAARQASSTRPALPAFPGPVISVSGMPGYRRAGRRRPDGRKRALGGSRGLAGRGLLGRRLLGLGVRRLGGALLGPRLVELDPPPSPPLPP